VETEIAQAAAARDQVAGYLLYAMTLVWQQRQPLLQIAGLGKPVLVADEFLGGSGLFLGACTELTARGIPVAAVSSRRLADLAAAAACFAEVDESTTQEQFARRCRAVYRRTFSRPSQAKCLEDDVRLTDIGACVDRFRRSQFLIIGRGRPGEVRSILGAKARFLDFSELTQLCEKVAPEQAAQWVDRWNQEAAPLPPGDYVEPSQPAAGVLENSARIYLASLELLKKYGAQTITMNCLGGFASGKLPAYPCLGFKQLLDDGMQGVCEAMPEDSVCMAMARILTGRPGYVSDPVLDTSENHIVYAHCVGTTRPFGPQGASNPFYLRTLHNRDPKGACAESLLPGGYMTTSFHVNLGRQEMVIHQAKAIGPLRTERGCRTKLLGEVVGDIGKMLYGWGRFGWHRVTVYGDLKEPLAEFGKRLGLTVVEEA